MAEFHIDFESIPDRQESQPIPAGDYLVEVSEGELADDIEQGSSTLKFVYTIIDGPFTGRTLRSNHAINHPNEQRVEIGLVTLKQMTRAVDLLQAGNTDEYLGRQCNVRVACEPGSNGKTYSNIKTWWSLSSQAPPVRQSSVRTVAPQATPQQPQQPRQQAPGQPQMWRPGNQPAQQPRVPQRPYNGGQQQGDGGPF